MPHDRPLGILVGGAAVIAADREESDGTLKSDQGKIGGAFVAGRGTLAISGAGNGPYLDSFTASMVDWFRAKGTDFEASAFGEELRRKNYEFYKRSVLPFAPYEESVDYELLACFYPAPTEGDIALASAIGGIPGKGCEMWTSHKLSLLKVEGFAAVGVGATTAKAMLAKLLVPFIPLEVAISLAAYVAYYVKRTVKDVGLDTDVLVINRDALPKYVPKEEISEMEAKFEEYGPVERANLYYCLGGNLSEQERFLGKPGDHKRRQKSLRDFFESLNKERVKRWTLSPVK
jgi:hypothetical protein